MTTIPEGYKFKGVGLKWTAIAGTTTDCDYEVAAERDLDAVDLILENHSADDTLTFQVVDVNNVLGYGPGVVLNEFATNWRIDPTKRDQGEPFTAGYRATILAGLFLRIKYASTGTTDVILRVNYSLHEPPP